MTAAQWFVAIVAVMIVICVSAAIEVYFEERRWRREIK
jgi:hypothetical protein